MGEVPLPIDIIHHIQSFLDGKQAARTSAVSRWWYIAWSTRPDLYFSLGSPCCRHREALSFQDFANKTLKRYQQLNLNVETCTLELPSSNLHPYWRSAVDELIEQVVKLRSARTNFKLIVSGANSYVLPSPLLQSDVVSLSLSGCRIDPPPFALNHSRLKSLTLEDMSIDVRLFSNTFPCLENLTMVDCQNFHVLHISGPSFKRIHVEGGVHDFNAVLDVPQICEFKYFGQGLPTLSFTSASEEWECNLSVIYTEPNLSYSWFYTLRKLLKMLNMFMAKVSLSVSMGWGRIYTAPRLFPWRNVPKLENLRFCLPSPFLGYDAFVDAMLRNCRPKFITQLYREGEANEELFRVLRKGLSHSCGDTEYLRYVFLLHLRKIDVEVFEETLHEWRPLHSKSLANGSKDRDNMQKIRFTLEWQEI